MTRAQATNHVGTMELADGSACAERGLLKVP